MKKQPKSPNDLVIYLNKVRDYIAMEYDEELSRKMTRLNYIDIVTGYIKNCLSINKSVPYAAYGIAKLLKNLKEKNDF